MAKKQKSPEEEEKNTIGYCVTSPTNSKVRLSLRLVKRDYGGGSKEVATKASLTPLSNHVNNGKSGITLHTVRFGNKITQRKCKLLFIYFLDMYQSIYISFA